MHAYHLDINTLNYNQGTWEEQVEEECAIKLNQIINQLIAYKPDLTIKFEKVLSKGFAVDKIVEESINCRADIIILNSKGSEGFSDKVAGSVSTNVIESTKTPVLIIPVKIDSIQFKKIVFSFQPEMMDKTNFTFLVKLIKMYQAELIIFSVLGEEVSREDQSKFEQKITKRIEEHGFYQFQLEFVQGDDIIQELEKYSSNHPIDLLVMVRGKKNFWEKMFKKGNTRKMAAQIEFPLMIMQEN